MYKIYISIYLKKGFFNVFTKLTQLTQLRKEILILQ